MQERGVLLVFATLLAILPGPSATFLGKSKPSSVTAISHDVQELMQLSSEPESSGYQPEMKEVHHSKESGSGYHPGSPLYEKQQERKEKGIKSDITPDTSLDFSDPENFLAMWEKHFSWKEYAKWALISALPALAVTFLVALLYIKRLGRHEPYVQKTVMQGADGFSYGLCSCEHCVGHHSGIVMCALCCLPIRWADTMSKEPVPKFLNFWVALLLVSSLFYFSEAFLCVPWLIFLGLSIYYRQKLRREYGIVNCFEGAPMTLVQDCLVWFFCACPAAVQEARQVEFCQAAKGLGRAQYPPTAAAMMYQSASYQSTGVSSMASQRM
mmetsp:Transcript_37756/g.69919  ORF Transcript_37756/g.69919 Transcript_37756/m.69919 type:complete len:326 (+) Transcript_37756:134-1111(+)